MVVKTLENLNIYIVDDEPESLGSFKDWCTRSGYSCQAFLDPTEFLKAYKGGLHNAGPHIVLTDLLMPQLTGMQLFAQAKEVFPDAIFIFMTGLRDINAAVEAMKSGAFDYFSKSIEFDEFQLRLKRAFGLQKLQDSHRQLEEKNKAIPFASGPWGESAGIQSVYALIRKVSQVDSPVLLTGEFGTGLDGIARELHQTGSDRGQVYIAVRGNTLTPESLKAHLEKAEGGTLFISAVDSLSAEVQADLVDYLDQAKPGVRIIAGTFVDLNSLRMEGQFKEKLYYQLSVCPIALPPLRERIADIPFLSQSKVTIFANMWGRPGLRFSDNALKVLMNYSWPGNCVEFESTIERAVILSESAVISEECICFDIPGSEDPFEWLHKVQSLPTLKEFELEFIKEALRRSQGRKERAAKILGIGRKTLYRKELELKTQMEGLDERT